MKNCIAVLFFLLFFLVGIAQNSSAKDVYKMYYGSAVQEAVYLHLNKTAYLVGEEIWFKAYLFDKRNSEIAAVSTNLYVGLYDKEGKQIKQKLYAVKNGKVYGNISLNDSLFSETYYVKAATQQITEDRPADAFVEEITIYGKNSIDAKKETAQTIAAAYDIQFLPEGGHFVADVENNVGIKAINHNGKGVTAKGVIANDKNLEIASFETNHLGIGTVKFVPKSGIEYKAIIKFQDTTTQEKILPKATSIGIAIQVDNFQKDSVHISFKTNKKSLPKIDSKTFSLLIHKDGLVRSMEFSFHNQTIINLSIPKNTLFHGVNTITLFEGKIPILERMFFNHKTKKELRVAIIKRKTGKQATDFSLFLVKNKKGLLDADASISILPLSTKASNPANSIFSAFLLKPYVRGAIENPKYYFLTKTNTRKKALDALLITQGWSAYNWESIFQDKPLQPKQNQGMVIHGKVNYPSKRVENIFLHDTKNAPAQSIPVNKNNEFTITNIFPEENEKLRFSYVNPRKKRFTKPKLYLRYSINAQKDEIAEMFSIDRMFAEKNSSFYLPDGFFSIDNESLNAVVLEAVNKKELKETKDPMMVRGKETVIGIEQYLQYPLIKDVISNSGYQVLDDQVSATGLYITPRRRMTLEGNPVKPLIFMDDVPLTDFSILRDLSSAKVERIIIDKSGLGYGVRGTGGVIKIYSRKTPLTAATITRRDSFIEKELPIGYSVSKEYYKPKYFSVTNEIYQSYGVVDWKPDITIPRRGSFDFTVKHEKLSGIIMYIEGVSKDGSLISMQKIISFEEEN